MKVRVKDLEWFEKNCSKNENNSYLYSDTAVFSLAMRNYCGKIIELNSWYPYSNGWYYEPWMYDVIEDDILRNSEQPQAADIRTLWGKR